jgi:flagellar biosynthesis chaperone FliJ
MNKEYIIEKTGDNKVTIKEVNSIELSKEEIENRIFQINESLAQLEKQYNENRNSWLEAKKTLQEALDKLENEEVT